MKKENGKLFYTGAILIALFVLWTVLVCVADVEAIGPDGSEVGFARLNGFVHRITGTHTSLYVITDWLGLIPLCFIVGFGILGLTQWIKRKSILNVDFSIRALGIFYIVVMAIYVFFEYFVVNYRPVLINGYLEASYPSSTTMLVMCVMPTAIMQFNRRIKKAVARRCISSLIIVFIAFMVIGRLASGVHWFSDIVGGALFSGGVVSTYGAVILSKEKKCLIT